MTTAEDKDKRTNHFQHTVLIGLWAIILLLMRRESAGIKRAVYFRENAIMFGNQFGVPGKEAERVRCDITYGGL